MDIKYLQHSLLSYIKLNNENEMHQDFLLKLYKKKSNCNLKYNTLTQILT